MILVYNVNPALLYRNLEVMRNLSLPETLPSNTLYKYYMVKSMAKTRVKNKAMIILNEHGNMNTVALKSHINAVLKDGTTSSELGNILSSNHEFRRIRQEKINNQVGSSAGTYSVWIWGLEDK